MNIRSTVSKPAKLVCLFLLFSLCLSVNRAEALPDWTWWPFKINRFDKEGRFHGRWKVYMGEGDEKVLLRNGRFRNGKEVGTWRYYYPGGGLYILEKHKRWQNTFTMKRFYENGNLKKEGMVIMINNGKGVDHFWYGDWKVYDEQGNYTHTEVYEKGNLVSRR